MFDGADSLPLQVIFWGNVELVFANCHNRPLAKILRERFGTADKRR
jgi:hypothetical protein